MAQQADAIRVPVPEGTTLDDLAKTLARTVAPSPDMGWEWNMFLYGLENAAQRYRDALGAHSGLFARVAVGEALWWVAAADEFLRERVSGLGSRRYYAELAKQDAGGRLAGLVYLRHRAGHQFARAVGETSEPLMVQIPLRLDDGSSSSAELRFESWVHLKPDQPAPLDGFRFQPLAHLPPPSRPEKSGRDRCYDDHVAGRDVADVLGAVAQSLRSTLSFNQKGAGPLEVVVNWEPIRT